MSARRKDMTYAQWKAEYVKIGGWDDEGAKALRDEGGLLDYYNDGFTPQEAYDSEANADES